MVALILFCRLEIDIMSQLQSLVSVGLFSDQEIIRLGVGLCHLIEKKFLPTRRGVPKILQAQLQMFFQRQVVYFLSWENSGRTVENSGESFICIDESGEVFFCLRMILSPELVFRYLDPFPVVFEKAREILEDRGWIMTRVKHQSVRNRVRRQELKGHRMPETCVQIRRKSANNAGETVGIEDDSDETEDLETSRLVTGKKQRVIAPQLLRLVNPRLSCTLPKLMIDESRGTYSVALGQQPVHQWQFRLFNCLTSVYRRPFGFRLHRSRLASQPSRSENCRTNYNCE